jgi:hypothetical protein
MKAVEVYIPYTGKKRSLRILILEGEGFMHREDTIAAVIGIQKEYVGDCTGNYSLGR